MFPAQGWGPPRHGRNFPFMPANRKSPDDDRAARPSFDKVAVERLVPGSNRIRVRTEDAARLAAGVISPRPVLLECRRVGAQFRRQHGCGLAAYLVAGPLGGLHAPRDLEKARRQLARRYTKRAIR